jgi:hypothetical protein
MKLGEINIFRGVDTTTALGEYSAPSALNFIKDTSDSLGAGTGITNVTEVNNIVNNIIGATAINSFYDVDPNLPDAPEGSYMVMGAGGEWTYGSITPYSLPTATVSILGGVKIGNGLTITAGVVSVDPSTMPSADISAQDILDWDESFSWGDHSLVGYALTSALSAYSLTSHTHSYLPLAGGAMGNTTLVINLNAALLEGHAASYFAAAHSHPYLSDSEPRIANWDSAYSWGDHSTEGYITLGDVPAETDPVFTAWNKTSGISIVATQVSDLTTAINANTYVSTAYAARHNAVTIGTANGLSLSTQAISLRLADISNAGALSAYDWNRFDQMLVGLSYQALEDQSLSTSDTVSFAAITAPYIEASVISDDSTSLGSLAGFESGNGVIQRYSDGAVQTFLGLGTNAYSSDEYYDATNASGFVHEITSDDGSVTIADIVYSPVDATKHGIDLSVQGLVRYQVVATSGSEVEVLANKPGITASFSGQTLTFVIPAGVNIVSAKIRFGSYSSLIVKTGVNDMGNTSVNDRWIPAVQAWREDTRSQLMAVNAVPSASEFDEITINGLINTTTNHIRLMF